MSQSQRQQKLETLKKLYRRRENAAAKEFAQASQVYSSEQAQLHNLEGLLQNYSENYEAQKASQGTAGALKRWQRFVDSLQEVAVKQARRVEQVQQQQQKKRGLWIKTHRDTRGIEKLQEKLAREREQKLQRAEQNLLDELSRQRER